MVLKSERMNEWIGSPKLKVLHSSCSAKKSSGPHEGVSANVHSTDIFNIAVDEYSHQATYARTSQDTRNEKPTRNINTISNHRQRAINSTGKMMSAYMIVKNEYWVVTEKPQIPVLQQTVRFLWFSAGRISAVFQSQWKMVKFKQEAW